MTATLYSLAELGLGKNKLQKKGIEEIDQSAWKLSK